MAQHPPPLPAANTVSGVDALMSATFSIPREPRSNEYKAGVRAVLEFRIEGKPMPFPPPFDLGTAAADAYFAGVDEGRAIWTATQSKAPAP